MSDTAQGPGWWLASDGKWYPPQLWTGPPGSGPTGAPGQGPSSGPAAAYGQPVVKKNNGLAVASLVCSCAGILFLGVPGILGIVFGFVALSQIRRSEGTQRGEGLALAGIIVGFAWIAIVIAILVIAGVTSNSSGVIHVVAVSNRG